ncbi:MAG: GH25 family lysozyme [Pseudomonadota bacterium]
MNRRTVLSLCLIVAGCGASRSGSEGTPTPTSTVTAPRFRDADPQVWDGRAPDSYPVHGIDLSRFQTSVDWATARANGVNFAFIKATEGADQIDPLFREHWRGAGQAGVARGAYHFYYHCRPAIEQARWFFRQVPRTPGALPPVLDMEWTPTSPTCRIRRDASVIRAEAQMFLDAAARHYGQRPILYTTVDFFEDNELWRLAGTEFWLRSTAAHPRDAYDGQSWTFWQYTGTGRVPGIGGQVDINAFAGSREAWARWRAARAQ